MALFGIPKVLDCTLIDYEPCSLPVEDWLDLLSAATSLSFLVIVVFQNISCALSHCYSKLTVQASTEHILKRDERWDSCHLSNFLQSLTFQTNWGNTPTRALYQDWWWQPLESSQSQPTIFPQGMGAPTKRPCWPIQTSWTKKSQLKVGTTWVLAKLHAPRQQSITTKIVEILSK